MTAMRKDRVANSTTVMKKDRVADSMTEMKSVREAVAVSKTVNKPRKHREEAERDMFVKKIRCMTVPPPLVKSV